MGGRRRREHGRTAAARTRPAPTHCSAAQRRPPSLSPYPQQLVRVSPTSRLRGRACPCRTLTRTPVPRHAAEVPRRRHAQRPAAPHRGRQHGQPSPHGDACRVRPSLTRARVEAPTLDLSSSTLPTPSLSLPPLPLFLFSLSLPPSSRPLLPVVAYTTYLRYPTLIPKSSSTPHDPVTKGRLTPSRPPSTPRRPRNSLSPPCLSPPLFSLPSLFPPLFSLPSLFPFFLSPFSRPLFGPPRHRYRSSTTPLPKVTQTPPSLPPPDTAPLTALRPRPEPPPARGPAGTQPALHVPGTA
jgi:hypothetical protein